MGKVKKEEGEGERGELVQILGNEMHEMGSTILLRDMTNPPLYSLLPLCLPQGDFPRKSVGIEAVRMSDRSGLWPFFEFGERVVAECVEKLTLLDPDTLPPRLKVRG